MDKPKTVGQGAKTVGQSLESVSNLHKFNKKRIEVMKEHVINKKKFWVEKYDYAIEKELISEEELQTAG